MAKLEQKIKKELEQRTIAPSAGSWDKLSSQLETQDKKKGGYKWYLGIAASFLAGILIASFFGNGNETEVQVVNTQEKTTPNSASEKQENIFSTEIEGELVYDTQRLKEIVGELPGQKEADIQKAPKVKAQKENINKNKRLAKAEKKSFAASDLKKQKDLIAAEDSEKTEHELEMNENQSALLAQVEDKEIDELLENARRNVRLRQFSNPYARVSAKELLQNIEVEDKESFKEKIFLALETGFQHVKSSVIK